ncbi:MAG: peroxiredoxin [Planctomycetes bacterium]|nr:peroxiredoxin [Planctomycetota bacterium]
MSEPATLTPAPTLPRLNEPAPDFEATTSQGSFRLSEKRGKWVVLFSHPADFTPVCTTEFVEFAKRYEEFRKRNVELVGLSVDSGFSHIGWIRNIESTFKIQIPFPVIADRDMRIAQLYGMIHKAASDTATVRCVFFIDDKGTIRAMIYYPMTNGRNMDEILRLVDAIQTSDKHACATPANWRPGEKVIVPPPKTTADATKRTTEGYECKDWYLCFKEVPATSR